MGPCGRGSFKSVLAVTSIKEPMQVSTQEETTKQVGGGVHYGEGDRGRRWCVCVVYWVGCECVVSAALEVVHGAGNIER